MQMVMIGERYNKAPVGHLQRFQRFLHQLYHMVVSLVIRDGSVYQI